MDLTTLDGIATALSGHAPGNIGGGKTVGAWNDTFCSRCGAARRSALTVLSWNTAWRNPYPVVVWLEPDDPKASLFVVICLQCHHETTVIVHKGPAGWELVALPQEYGGLSTPHTPEGVAYYLDQAQRSQSVGARSAAVVMYRSALEHLLHEQGYKTGMLGVRIKALMDDQSPPKWRDELDPDYLTVINALGNAAIHANDGDVAQQAAFETQLLIAVRELFVELLTRIYERPQQDQARMAGLKAVIDGIKRK